MRIVIIGSGGRLGAALARHFRQCGHAVVAFDRTALDLARREIIHDRLDPLAFDACVVTAALTNVDHCETHPAEAEAVNAAGPALVAEICARRGARLIHLSTDYVYGGTRPGLRVESEPAAPINVYGASKLEGERRVLEATGGSALIVRTSWLFGPDRPSFPETIIDRARRNSAVCAIAEKVSSPTSTLDFGHHLEPFLVDPSAGRTGGVVNICNLGSTTWHQYAQTTLDLAGELGIPVRCHRVDPIPIHSMTSFTAARPVNTAMSVDKLIALTSTRPRPWQDALREFLATYFVSPGDRSGARSLP